ncbi:MAG: glycoside hydrolase domain-containing protein [Pirellulaceae bacterium]
MDARAKSVILGTMLWLALASFAAAEWRVWAESGTERVLRDAPAAKESTVHLAAARNEWESFQILLRSDDAVEGVVVEPGSLHGPQGCVLNAQDARLYRQHQLEIAVGTYRNDAFKPGWYADPLIPFRHPLSRQPLSDSRLRAVPFDLPARQTHGFWVDLHVPASAAPGEYRGVYRVRGNGRSDVEIPISLTVWNFTLPDTMTLKTAFGSPAGRMRNYYRRRASQNNEPEPSDWAMVENQCAELLARHHINATLTPGSLAPVKQADGTYRIPRDQLDALREFVDRYHVNAVPVPRPTGIVKDLETGRAELHGWLKSWDEAAAALDRPDVVFYTYLKDEPNDEEAYRFVQAWGKAVREVGSVVKVLVVEQTWTQNAQWGDLYGSVDIWCPLFSLFREASAVKRQAGGETLWTYTALCQGEPTPWWHIDFPLQHYRVPAWIAWRYRIRGILYWGGMSYWSAVDDPWSDPATYPPRERRAGGRVYNGEGTLVYPGRPVGYDGIAPSLRLKSLRDAIEDYEYLAMLERCGLANKAQDIIAPLVTSWYQWNKDASAYQTARAQLAALLESSEK